ncbi:molybdenum ABC transporter [Arcobacter cloacae]|uniref:Molybdenum ABC transporter n=1 Tax=Arcobacter cloacae TaxID=1054034 RepID=A0A6M8NGR4_9BACT|nr:molybdenum ABC transporter [Arcobacter cloacae]QKF89509.1 quinolinate phosphoribosyltransferase-like protein [Arcobacter cloacae]RXI42752.1 molybdenum ABC transporter [Arcobacter cloacae]
MFDFTDNELLELLKEDVPFLDLTTYLQDINDKKARLEIYTREDIVVSCSEESARIAKLMNCEVDFFVPSKQKIKKGELILSFIGDYNLIHKIWRTTQLILEYSCKIATYTQNMKEEILKVNNHCELLTTRKTYPFAKKFCIKSILVGGAFPHRLNLSETVLLFPHHRKVYATNEEFYYQIKEIKQKALEKKIIIESSDFNDTINLMKYGADVLQLDKMDVKIIDEIVRYKNNNFPWIKLLVSGNINLSNVKDFASTQIDGVVSSSMYLCGMSDLGTKLTILE